MEYKKYILWDLDGTIVESEDSKFKYEMFKHASNLLSLDFDLKPDQYIGHEAQNVFRTLLVFNKITDEDYYWNLYTDWYECAINYIKLNVNMVKPHKNIISLWNSLSKLGILHAVVTSSRNDVACAYLKNIGLLDSCIHLTCINDVVSPKPSPIPYLTAMKKLSITGKDCIAIEDSVTGITSAKAAGLFTIGWVKDVNIFSNSTADILLEELSESEIINALLKTYNG